MAGTGPSSDENARAAWRRWYRDHGRQVISTRVWKDLDAFRESGRRDLEFLVDRFGLPAGGRVHEIGCGPGRLTQHLVARFDQVTANDICDEAAADCRTLLGPDVEVSVGGAGTLASRPSGSYDAVVSIATLQHVGDCDEVIAYVKHAARMLKPEGVALLQLSDLTNRRAWQDGAVDALRRVAMVFRGPSRPAPRGRYWRGCRPDDWSLLAAARSAGAAASLQGDGLRTWLRIGPPA